MKFEFRPNKALFKFLRNIFFLILIVGFLFLITKRSMPNFGLIFGVILASQIPTFVLFIQYYINDNKAEFIFEKSKNRLFYNKRSESFAYLLEQITLIELNARATRFNRNGFSLFSSDDYFYYKISFFDGKSIIVTSLILDGKIINEANFRGINFQKQAHFFSFLPDNK